MKGTLFCLLFITLFAPGISGAAESIQFEVEDITDRRSNQESMNQFGVDLLMKGAPLAKCRGFRNLEITRAVDDTGASLLREAKPRSGASSVYDFTKSFGESAELKQTLQLNSPSRTAAMLKELSGSVEFYFPGRDPNSRILVKGFMKSTGKALPHAALKKGKIELKILDHKQAQAMKEAEKKAREEKQAKETKSPEEAMLTEAVGAVADMFSEAFSSVGETDLLFIIQDPNGKLVDLEILDAAGNPLHSGGRSTSGDRMTISFDALPGNDAQLAIYLATPKSLVKTPFNLKDVALP